MCFGACEQEADLVVISAFFDSFNFSSPSLSAHLTENRFLTDVTKIGLLDVVI